MDRQPPRADRRTAQGQPPGDRRPGHRRRRGRYTSSCGDSSVTRCPTAAGPPPIAASRVRVTVAVIADPAIADQVQAHWPRPRTARPPTRSADRCVKVAVQAADSDAGWSTVSPRPLARRSRRAPGTVDSGQLGVRVTTGDRQRRQDRHRQPAAGQLPCRAGPASLLKDALTQQSWSTLPALQSNPAGLDGLNLPGSGGLKLSLPLTGDSDAANLAAEAVAAAFRPARTVRRPPTVPVPRSACARRRSPNWPIPRPAPRTGCLDQRRRPGHCTRARRRHHRAEAGRAGKPARCGQPSSLSYPGPPPGPVAVDRFPAVLLSGDSLSKEQISAASESIGSCANPSS